MATTVAYALEWDKETDKIYESGVNHGVLYVKNTGAAAQNAEYGEGVVWNGLTSVSENSEGGEPNDVYADNIKYLSIPSNEDAGLAIEAYTYPDQFAECDGSKEAVTGVLAHQQPRKKFGFVYSTKIGDNDVGLEKGEKIHIYYNCLAAPSERSYQTINDSPEAITFSWDISTTPVSVDPSLGLKPLAHITIDSTKLTEAKLESLKQLLYGTKGEGQNAGTAPRLPSIGEIITLLH